MPPVPSHCHVETHLPPAVRAYFVAELETLDDYLKLVPDTIDAGTGDATVGPVQAVPWVYVPDLTGWRGFALARLLAAERDCPCYQLSALARDGVSSLWGAIEQSADGPVVIHVELRGDTGPIPGTLREAVRRGFDQPPQSAGDGDPVSGDPSNLVVVLTDTQPSKRLTSPLPAATSPVSGAVLSYAPRDSMTPEQPDGTTALDAPPAMQDRTARLVELLSGALDGVGNSDQRERFVDDAVEALTITQSTIGRQDLLFDVSPRVALKHGHRLEQVGPAEALSGLRRDILAGVPQSPGSADLRRTLADLLPE